MALTFALWKCLRCIELLGRVLQRTLAIHGMQFRDDKLPSNHLQIESGRGECPLRRLKRVLGSRI
jgi:hypothetical protein